MSKLKIFLLLLTTTFIAYGTSIIYGFSQDDWFHLSISRAGNIKEFINFFNPLSVSWIFFRPLSTQVPYWLGTSLFSDALSPQFMHVLMLVLHASNAYLVFLISRKYIKEGASLLLGIFYSISSVHFLSLFYIGAIQQLISTLFSLLAIHLFIKRPRANQLILATLTVCALLSKELAIRLPVLLFIIAYIEEKDLFKAFKDTLGPILVTILYFAIRMISGMGGASEYLVSFNPATTMATIMWYSLFFLGLPEDILNYGLSGGMIDFGTFALVSPITKSPIFLGATFLLGYAVYQIIKTIKVREDWNWFIFPLLALINIFPILFLPTHRYPHYLDISILFVGIWLLRDLNKVQFKHIIFFVIISLGMLSSIVVERSTHWTVKRSIIASRVEAQLIAKGDCHTISELVFVGPGNEPLEVSYAMSLMNGPRIICNNLDLQVYYLSDQLPSDYGDATVINTRGLVP